MAVVHATFTNSKCSRLMKDVSSTNRNHSGPMLACRAVRPLLLVLRAWLRVMPKKECVLVPAWAGVETPTAARHGYATTATCCASPCWNANHENALKIWLFPTPGLPVMTRRKGSGVAPDA